MSDPYVLHNQVRILVVEHVTFTKGLQASRSPPPGPASSSSDSSSTATIASNSDVTNAERALSPIVDRLETIIDSTTAAQSAPSNDAIEAAIRAAINSGESRSSPSIASSGMGGGDGRTVPPRDTRTQLFVGNVRAFPLMARILLYHSLNSPYTSCHIASAGRTSRISSVEQGPCSEPTSPLGRTTVLEGTARFSSPPLKTLEGQSTCSTGTNGRGGCSKSGWTELAGLCRESLPRCRASGRACRLQ